MSALIVCKGCGKNGNDEGTLLKKCKYCEKMKCDDSRFYCSDECFALDWPKHKQWHKKQKHKVPDEAHAMVNRVVESFNKNQGLEEKEAKELYQKLTQGALSRIDEAKAIIRKLTVLSGTDVNINDSDPYGDGDQRDVLKESKRQILRNLFSDGGDLESCLVFRGLSPFGYACAQGNKQMVLNMIKATKEWSNERMQLLEKRETSLRLSPLLITIAFSKAKSTVCYHTGVSEINMDHVGVVEALLRYGARPDVKELSGRTVIHYAAGCMATTETLKMTDYLIDAAKSSKYFGKEVVLRNLAKEEYNGLTATVGGYLVKTKRREVILSNDRGRFSLDPVKLFSVNEGGEKCIVDSSRNLINDLDRLSTISLHEVFMSQRVDVAQFLVDRKASIDVGEVTVRSMSQVRNAFGISSMSKIIQKYATKLEKKGCAYCQTLPEQAFKCSRCRTAIYCSSNCQRAHWSQHKLECIRQK